jgi:hypothetical protein
MIDKFYIWVGRNRRTIGSAIAGLGIASGILSIFAGNVAGGVLSIAVAYMIVSDISSM